MGTIQQYHMTNGYVTPLVTNLANPKVLAVFPDEPYGLVKLEYSKYHKLFAL